MSVPTSHRRIAVIADAELGDALTSVRAATGTHEADATLVHRLAIEGARAELKAGHDRRAAAEALFAAMERGGFDLDLEAIDRLNDPRGAPSSEACSLRCASSLPTARATCTDFR